MTDTASPKVKKGQILALEIEDLAFGGRGVARADGLAVFVDNAVPGDSVRATIVKNKKNYAAARLQEVTAASPDRVQPVCRFCGFCGGCRLQILDYENQLAYKRDHVRQSLARIAFMPEVPVHPVLPAEKTLEYR